MAYNFTDVVFSLKGLHPTDKLVLLHLAEHADKETGECWPGFGRLADFTGLTRRTVIYSINRLEKLEVITIAPPTDTRKTNTYVVRMDKLVAAGVSPAAKRATRKYERTGKYRRVKKDAVTVTPTADDVDHLYTHDTWKEGPSKGQPCTWCAKCGTHISVPNYRVSHIEQKHPELWAEVIQALASQPEIEFIDESKATTESYRCCNEWPNCICDDDDLA